MSVEIDGVNNIIKADTISEVTSANGVTIDGLTIKDGNIIGDVALAGTTPTFTVGDGGAEDASLIFDGNAVDFVMGVDDSADEFRIGVGTALGSDRVFEINSSGVSTFQKAVNFAGTTPTVTIGDGGAEDAKIIFDGNAQNFYIGLDDSTDKLTIGLGNALGTYPGFTMDQNTAVEFPDNTVTIISSGNHDMLTLKSTDADSGVGPVMAFVRDSASPDAGDFLGALVFDADDSGGNSHQFVEINAVMQTHTNGSEDGRLRISSSVAGTNRNRLDILAAETVFNEDSVDLDFRVEGNSDANLLFVNAGDDKVGIGHNNPSQLFSVKKDQNADTAIRVANATGGTAARAAIFLDVDSGGAQLMAIDDGFSTSGAYIADNVTFVSDTSLTNGMTIGTRSSNGNAHLRFYTQDSQKLKINSTGGLINTMPINNVYGIDNEITTSSGNSYGQKNTFTGYSPDDNTSSFYWGNDNVTARFGVYSDGDVQNHDNSYGAFSDERIKQDIRDANSQWEE